MSTEKMMKEFIEAFVEQYGFGRMAASSNPDAAAMLACAEWAWFKSRAAIEVELPQIVGYEAGFDSIRENEFAAQSGELFDADEVFALSRSIEVREAIESLGLKVKG